MNIIYERRIIMKCSNCGNEIPDGASTCSVCGQMVSSGADARACPKCGAENSADYAFCSNCGTPLNGQGAQYNPAQGNTAAYNSGQSYARNMYMDGPPKSRLVAGLLGLFFGSIVVHSFYLGNTTRGVLQIIVTVITCGIGSLWGFIEGILILCRHINTDSRGIPLKNDC